MKINVITVEDVKISRFRWWSNWLDVACFDYGGNGYLLQMKVSRTNSKKFKHIALKGIGVAHPSHHQIADLTQTSA